MAKSFILLCLSCPYLLLGCATATKSTVLGAAVGVVAGGSIGALASRHASPAGRTEGLILGGGLGGVLGALIGRVVHKEKGNTENQGMSGGISTEMELFGNGDETDKRPHLRPAQIKVKYVEDQIKDGLFVPAHFEYEIAEPARWEPSK